MNNEVVNEKPYKLYIYYCSHRAECYLRSVYASESEEITSLSASYASGKVTVTGETIENVMQ
jgi:hypothetical protein